MRLGLDSFNPLLEMRVVGWPVAAGVDPSVAIRTEGYDKPRVVRPTVAHTADMVGLKVWRAVRPAKRRRGFTAFANAQRSGQNVISHVGASLVDGARCRLLRRSYTGGGKRPLPKGRERVRRWRDSGDPLVHRMQGTKLKYDCVSFVSLAVGRTLYVISDVDHLIDEAQSFLRFSEQEERFTVFGVIPDCAIASDPFHWPNLSLAEVFKSPVWKGSVRISVCQAFLAGDDDHNRMTGRCDDPALLLTTKTRVNILAPIVRPADFESVAHRFCLPWRERNACPVSLQGIDQ